MIKKLCYCSLLSLTTLFSIGQSVENIPTKAQGIFFVSDTQKPMWVEKLILKPNHNTKATALEFDDILQKRPRYLYMLGDVVAVGASNHQWKKVDKFLSSCSQQGSTVCGVLGNHEVLVNKKKGERNFDKRFPMNVSTGYVSIADSVAVVLLNSNFNKLSEADINKQQSWYDATLKTLDETDSIKVIIVACHHAPYTNSKIVGCSKRVQQYFVPGYIQSKKAQLFITGHSHNFEHFKKSGKDFLVIGGGGGLHQPLNTADDALPDEAINYKPMFHYLSVTRIDTTLSVTSYFLKDNFSGFEQGQNFTTTENATKKMNYVTK